MQRSEKKTCWPQKGSILTRQYQETTTTIIKDELKLVSTHVSLNHHQREVRSGYLSKALICIIVFYSAFTYTMFTHGWQG